MPRANSWHGDFPWRARRGYSSTAPVGSYPANGYGPYGMAGNVWEWTSGWYQQHDAGDGCCAPIDPPVYPRGGGRDGSLDPRRYRPAARRPQMVDTGMSHIGCRCAAPLAEGGFHNR